MDRPSRWTIQWTSVASPRSEPLLSPHETKDLYVEQEPNARTPGADAIDILLREHELIVRVLDLLDECGRVIAAGQSPPEGFAPWAVCFCREFADRRHHAKEEDILFPLLESRGLQRDGGPTGVMLHEHEVGRGCVGRMERAAVTAPPDLAAFAAAAGEFAPLLRQHIFKENNVLFQMARQILAPDDVQQATERFAEVEAQLGGDESRLDHEREVERWEDAFRAG